MLQNRIGEYLKLMSVPFTLKYIDPSYIIRSAPANAVDAVFCQELAQNGVHAAMTGRTETMIGLWNQHYVHVPLATATSKRKRLDPDDAEWRSVTAATGQPLLMKN